jgi:hypothetical protein
MVTFGGGIFPVFTPLGHHDMEDALLYDRIQFGFTISFHYLFPQLTMGLSLLMVWFKWRYLRTGDPIYNDAAKFWMKIFALNFMMGVVTGIPMEFQFGTNWAKFSERTGGIIGQTLGDGGHVFLLPGELLPRPVLVWGKAARAAAALPHGISWSSSVLGSVDGSSSPRTPGCSIRWAMRSWRMAVLC